MQAGNEKMWKGNSSLGFSFKENFKVDVRNNFFTQILVTAWNVLSGAVGEVVTIMAFKRLLDRHMGRECKDMNPMQAEQISLTCHYV